MLLDSDEFARLKETQGEPEQRAFNELIDQTIGILQMTISQEYERPEGCASCGGCTNKTG